MKLVACKVFVFSFMLLLMGCSSVDYRTEEGLVFGSTYRIIYQSDRELADSVQQVFDEINHSLSTYNDRSVISQWNHNQPDVKTDRYLLTVFCEAKQMYNQSGGAFDLTVAPLVDAWGFGRTPKDSISPALIDSLRQFVGMDKISVQDGRLIKSDKRISLDVNALAPGYCADLIAELFNRHCIRNFLIDIGGEIRTQGVNIKNTNWQIGIDKPIDNMGVENPEIQTIVSVSGWSLATSGNYRHFYVKDGKKVAHTINPHTGYPAETDVLSVSVITQSCMQADALATAIMVLGRKKGLALADSLSDTEAYVIYNDDKGENQVEFTSGFQSFLSENK
jgi:thiamine biosynthesis lipoprotein